MRVGSVATERPLCRHVGPAPPCGLSACAL
jgi:hypothetical protein